ncbi:hypothetical protein [Cetobacterium sp.]|uniref:hypothetical protein n=1 Tax=Cetobacterium sp. TaxID=2071632 RepID=UPI003F3A4606
MNELRLKDYIKYNPDIHTRRKEEYTILEIKEILSGEPLAYLSVSLGRPAKAIAEARSRFKKKYPEWVVKK